MAPSPTPPLPDPLPTPATLTLADLDLLNAAYPRLIAHLAAPADGEGDAKPRKEKDLTRLPALDHFRHAVLPQRLAARRAQFEPRPGRPDEADGYLDMAEAKELLEWKMCVPSPLHRFPPHMPRPVSIVEPRCPYCVLARPPTTAPRY